MYMFFNRLEWTAYRMVYFMLIGSQIFGFYGIGILGMKVDLLPVTCIPKIGQGFPKVYK